MAASAAAARAERFHARPDGGAVLEAGFRECGEERYELCWEKVKKPETKQQREFVGREERKKRGFYKQCVSYQKGFPQRGRPL